MMGFIDSMPTITTVKELAEILRTSTQTIIRDIKRGRLKAVKVGNGWRITKDAVVEYLELKK